METKKVFDVAVVGGGSAGSMAYLRSVLNFDDTVWFLGDADTARRARATWVFEVENIPGFHGDKKPIMGPAVSTRKWVESDETLKDKSTAVREKVVRMSKLDDGTFELTSTRKGTENTYRARYVILATGVMDVQPEIQGSIEPVFPFANRGDLIYCIRCDGHQVINKKLVVIGTPTTGLAIANLMHERYGNENIVVLTHGNTDKPDPKIAQRAEGYGVKIETSPIVSLKGDAKGSGLEGFALKNGQHIPAQRGIVALGSIVYNGLLKDLGGKLAEDGRILVRENNESSVDGVFAVGDLVSGKKMQIYTGWDEAVDAADAINRRLRAQRRSNVAA